MKLHAVLLAFTVLVACSGGSLEAFDEGEVVKPAEPTDPSATMPLPSASTNGAPAPKPPAVGDQKDGGAKEAVDAGGGVDGGGTAPTTCAGGVAESEPNDVTTKATAIGTGKTCGSAAPGDVDFFALDLKGTASIRFDATSDDVEFFMVDEEGGGDIPLFSGDEITMTASGKTFFRVESKTKQSYTITRQ